MAAVIHGGNCTLGKDVLYGEGVRIGHNVIIEDDVVIGRNTYIDSNTIIRSNVTIGEDSFIGSNCIIGEYWMDFCMDRKSHVHPLAIGDRCLIRSGSIVYAGSEIGSDFQTGHRATVRENSRIGDCVSIGTLSDIQGNCKIGNYVRMHSNVHVGQLSVIDDFAWIYPYAVLTNDPTPPSEHFLGVHIKSFAVVATGAVIMPGLEVGQDALVAAGAVVTKPVVPYSVVAGNPARQISDVRKVRNKITGESAYPWRDHFGNYMPWKDEGFPAWYAGLDIQEKERHKIGDIQGM